MKFVRIGDALFYSENPFALHSEVATEFGATEIAVEDNGEKPVVDDAGMMKIGRDKKIWFDESTTSAKVRGDRNQARERTTELAKGLFGDDEVSDSLQSPH